MTIPLVKNTFLEEAATKKALAEFILSADMLSFGERCERFQNEFAVLQGSHYALLFNSGGSANLAVLQALKNLGLLSDGDRIGFSSVTWSTNVMPIIQLGMIPVPVDCSRRTLNVMSAGLEAAMKKTDLKAFFLTNVLGFAGDLDVIRTLCSDRGIILLEDNCESLGTELPSGRTGNFGLASTFSFYVSHHMSTIEGGMVCTSSPELASMLKITRANGWNRNLDETEKKRFREQYGDFGNLNEKYTFYDLGFNLRPTEITGFLGSFQLTFLPESLRKRQRNYLFVEEAMLANDDLLPPQREHLSFLSNFAIPIVCKTPELRSLYSRKLKAAGVEIRPLIAGNVQRQPFFKKHVAESYDLPDADYLHECALYCGNHPDLKERELRVLAECLQTQ